LAAAVAAELTEAACPVGPAAARAETVRSVAEHQRRHLPVLEMPAVDRLLLTTPLLAAVELPQPEKLLVRQVETAAMGICGSTAIVMVPEGAAAPEAERSLVPVGLVAAVTAAKLRRTRQMPLDTGTEAVEAEIMRRQLAALDLRAL